MLKRRKESGTYLATDSRYRQSLQITMKVDKVCSFQPALRPSSAEEEFNNPFESNRDENGEWRKFYTEGVYGLHSTLNLDQIIRSRRLACSQNGM